MIILITNTSGGINVKNDISTDELNKLIDNILGNKKTEDAIYTNEYVDEKAESFIKSLKDMVK